MNSNGSQFLLVNDAQDFRTDVRDECVWDEQLQVFRLQGAQHGRFAHVPLQQALDAHAGTGPMVIDPHGLLGFLSDDHTRLLYSRESRLNEAEADAVTAHRPDNDAGPPAQDLQELSLQPVTAPPATRIIDLHLGGEGRAALLFSDGLTQHGLRMLHLGRRWQSDCELSRRPRRACVDHLNRTWVAGDDWLALCSGEPLPHRYTGNPATRFEPAKTNPHALTEHWSQPLPEGEELLALCCDTQRIFLLVWHADDSERGFRQSILSRGLGERADLPVQRHELPEELPFGCDIATLQDQHLVLMLPHDPEQAEHLDLPLLLIPEEAVPAQLLPERYPQHSQLRPRFISAADMAVRYLSATGPKQLHRLPQARYLPQGKATLNTVFDSGTPDTLWHKIYLDACIPPGCRLRISVKAFAEHDHSADEPWQLQQDPLWLNSASELPFHAGRFSPQPNRQGLFEILLQRSDGEVRDMRGRYLRVSLHMQGDGRHSPAIHAMRIYYPRLSWQQAYLPQHFHQQQRPDPQQKDMPGNGADLRERLLAVAEGLLTPIEERIAHAEYWSYPRACPSQHLPRLASTLGATLPAHWPEHRQREWLACYGWLSEHRGTLAGLQLALDIATDGGVSRGEVIAVENYRLRRTLASILGLYIDDAEHPLTLGTGQSGNSLVGESLILSEDDAQVFLSLFAPELSDRREQKALDEFFDNYAHRLSIVLHGPARAQRHSVERLLLQEAPAHLQWQLIETDHPFVLGLSPLLGIDTYLQQQPSWQRVVLDDTHLSREGILQNPISLAPAAIDASLSATPSANRGQARGDT